ncbi:hypothetical protein HDU93_008219, partial [Gonapodya sp. JEL0774]
PTLVHPSIRLWLKMLSAVRPRSPSARASANSGGGGHVSHVYPGSSTAATESGETRKERKKKRHLERNSDISGRDYDMERDSLRDRNDFSETVTGSARLGPADPKKKRSGSGTRNRDSAERERDGSLAFGGWRVDGIEVAQPVARRPPKPSIQTTTEPLITATLARSVVRPRSRSRSRDRRLSSPVLSSSTIVGGTSSSSNRRNSPPSSTTPATLLPLLHRRDRQLASLTQRHSDATAEIGVLRERVEAAEKVAEEARGREVELGKELEDLKARVGAVEGVVKGVAGVRNRALEGVVKAVAEAGAAVHGQHGWEVEAWRIRDTEVVGVIGEDGKVVWPKRPTNTTSIFDFSAFDLPQAPANPTGSGTGEPGNAGEGLLRLFADAAESRRRELRRAVLEGLEARFGAGGEGGDEEGDDQEVGEDGEAGGVDGDHDGLADEQSESDDDSGASGAESDNSDEESEMSDDDDDDSSSSVGSDMELIAIARDALDLEQLHDGEYDSSAHEGLEEEDEWRSMPGEGDAPMDEDEDPVHRDILEFDLLDTVPVGSNGHGEWDSENYGDVEMEVAGDEEEEEELEVTDYPRSSRSRRGVHLTYTTSSSSSASDTDNDNHSEVSTPTVTSAACSSEEEDSDVPVAEETDATGTEDESEESAPEEMPVRRAGRGGRRRA